MTQFTGADFKDWVLIILGNVFIIVLAGYALQAFAQKSWGGLVALIAGGALIAWIVYATPSFISFLNSAVAAFTGS